MHKLLLTTSIVASTNYSLTTYYFRSNYLPIDHEHRGVVGPARAVVGRGEEREQPPLRKVLEAVAHALVRCDAHGGACAEGA